MRRALLLTLSLGLALAAGGAAAQIATDGTVGPRVELAGPEFAIGAELGTRAGDNLFHSFERFSLRTGEGATFTGPDDLRNVISRVTGGERSNIDGALRSQVAGADFYFINPAGVLFGPNASINVPGSLHVSTADELRFEGGEVFSASDPSASSFSFAAPEAFGFLGSDAGEIRVAGSQLALIDPGQSLSFSGGGLVVENGSNIGANNLRFAAQASPGSVPLATTAPAEARSGTIVFGSEAPEPSAVIASFGLLGGTSRIEAGELRIVNAIVGDTHASPLASTGGIEVAAERVIIRNDNLPVGNSNGLITFSAGPGRAGDIRIAASDVTVVGGLIASVPVIGDGGRVTIEADRILLAAGATATGGLGAPAGLFPAAGRSGGIEVTAHESLTIGAGGEINAVSAGFAGDQPGGSIAINLDDGAKLIMQPGSLIQATANGPSRGGDIAITGGDVRIAGGVVSAETFAGGDGGSIDIDSGRLLLDNSFLGANSNASATGDAGPVVVKAERLEIRNEGRIFNGTNGIGNGGDVTVTAGTLLVDGALDHQARFNTGISAAAQAGSSGQSGEVTVDVDDSIVLRNVGEIASGTQGGGPAGNVVVDAPAITLQDGGRIDSSSTGAGNAGSLTITARDQLVLDRGQVSTSSQQSGGGRITIQVRELIDLQKSSIASSVAQDTGNAGNISIDPHFLVLDDSQILARAVAGRGGDISIIADNLVLSPDSLINAEAGDAGVDGTVATSEPAVDLASALVVLAAPLLDADSLLREPCAARQDVGTSSFTGAGRGGLPPAPDRPLGSAYRPPADLGATSIQPAALMLAVSCSHAD
jgi:filamentous hemagglutinin family protein